MADELPIQTFADFTEASRAALGFLQTHVGMGLWIITRTQGEDWIVLGSANREPRYAIDDGDVLRWSDAFCSRMVRGDGPQIAPVADQVAMYVNAPVHQRLPIGACIGMALRSSDGDLFGTLCAIDPEPQPGKIDAAGPFVAMVGRLLATVLDRELRLTVESRRAELAEAIAMVDDLTGAWNRRAWDRFRAAEEGRCRRYGHTACVLAVDLDDLKLTNDRDGHAAGDALIKRASDSLRHAVRDQDLVARIGGDEFGVLLVECGEAQGRVVEKRLREKLARAGVAASVGFASRRPPRDLDEAWTRADQDMYRQKRGRRRPRRGQRAATSQL